MMRNRFPLTLSLIAALTSPTLVAAHSNESHATQAKSEMSGKSGQHAAQGSGHAAALGKPASVNAVARTVEVDMGDRMRFKPERIEIKRGETIRFVVHNNGQVKHEMVLGTIAELKKHAALMVKFPEMEHDDPNAVSVEAGKTAEFAWTFTKAGNFDFACLVPGHFEAGMKGKIVVRR